ncbi:N-acetylmuramoyl-L-alanine amidase [Campylobacter upsaliensis]|uniref:N-acetylmuramoyl-L-alanine amidase n=2 Tax=Campylobacter upsaliensis TaxID=28080 RepID=A0A5L4Z2S9_CAMUP|nr:N-acetylmuramoyl-L-alanine amidase [Campylobacter upsaliensis]EAH4720440.1 N-acetylmuramoyl-L-alanine amidase [Campylobacter upsaliensis]EAH5886689.1 N-acetylmuramoyl-L-alanine amidase [Campylobacter upsaliensis]EAH7072397.1 N-acetylmuramoyl-L-alanine amidase [Campylobacter upsaliensis]EAH8308580.1 N-acetylmuramoyl-L-alanine amidase [Campylobacter upsaliensis]EAH8337333.1 N-acetylmuramoyl-L-alanine amidase [Campylobacter upsaliensis]
MRSLLALFLLFCFCFGAFEKQIEEFDKNFIGSTNDLQVKLHQQLKSLYIQSVINDDEKTKVEVLKRLIISSNTLKLDDTSYAKELEESGIKKANIESLRRVVIKDVKLEDKKPTEKPAFENVKENSKKEVVKKEELKRSDVTKKEEKIYILNSKKLANGVELNLSANLSEFKDFVLDEKGNYRHIIDFEAILEGGRKEFQFKNYNIILSQYNPKVVRIVLRAKEKISLNLKKEEKKVSILMTELKDVPKENQSIKTQKVEKKPEKQENNLKIQKSEKKSLYIVDVDKSENGVVLKFDEELDEEDFEISNTKDSKFYRQIVSFKGVLGGDRKSYTYGKNAITVTQYNPKVVRVVLSSAKEFGLYKDIDDKSLVLAFNEPKNQSFSPVKISPSKNTLNKNYKAGKIIVLDAGHGGKDSGALSKNKRLKEKDIVLSTTLKIGNELKKRGFKVYYTRTTDKFINLRDRTKIANDRKADLFLSIHANAAPNTSRAKSSEGLETFFLSPARSERSKKAAEKENQGDFEEMNYFSKQSILNFLNREKIVASNKLAIDIQKGVLAKTRTRYKVVDGGVREAPFWVLVGASMPAILLEIGYITHPSEGERIANKNFQDLLAKGIADGVENYFYHNR